MARPAAPQRLQRRRTKGWRMPPGAVFVGRPTKWGNPFRPGVDVPHDDPLYPHLAAVTCGAGVAGAFGPHTLSGDAAACVLAFTHWLAHQPELAAALPELRGRDIVCWCPLDAPCHAHALLLIANAEPRKECP